MMTMVLWWLAALLMLAGGRRLAMRQSGAVALLRWAALALVMGALLQPGGVNWVVTLLALAVGVGVARVRSGKMAHAMERVVAWRVLAPMASAVVLCAVGGTLLLTDAPRPVWTSPLLALGTMLSALLGTVVGWVALRWRGTVRRHARGAWQGSVAGLLLLLATGLALMVGFSDRLDVLGVVLSLLLAVLAGALLGQSLAGAVLVVWLALVPAVLGFALGGIGMAMDMPLLVMAGAVSGALYVELALEMARVLRLSSLWRVLRAPFADGRSAPCVAAEPARTGTVAEAVTLLARPDVEVVIVPGAGLLAAEAAPLAWTLAQRLEVRGVKKVWFAAHPVAGRVPGQVRAALLKAGVLEDRVLATDAANAALVRADVALVLGANDVVNVAAARETGNPLYGLPVLDVTSAQQVVAVRRGHGEGESGVVNKLFFEEKCMTVQGDVADVLRQMESALKVGS